MPLALFQGGERLVTERRERRETAEEANARVEGLELYTVFSLPHISQAYMFFRADLCDLDFSSGEESLDVQLFREDDIPFCAVVCLLASFK